VNLLRDYASHDFLKDRGEVLGEEDERTLVNLLTEQIEFADVVVLNKVTDAGPERTDAARKIVKALNPDAVLIEADRSRVPAQAILGTGLFDFETAHQHPMWAKELYGFADHVPETEEYGVTSFVYRARRPFDPAKVHAALTGDLPGVIRAKGHFWIATRPNWVAEFSLAGAMSSVTPLGGWWITVPTDRWPKDPEAIAKVRERWCEPWGDRRQEIVFIGSGMDREGIEAMLDAALVPEWEFVPEAWAGLPDPFPAWGRKAAA
jgi:G3E family GTPase